MGDDASVFRTTVRIPTASGDDLEVWVYQPDGHGPHPAVVMPHGFAGVKAGGLEPFAGRFCREGFTAIAFDYRHWGGSSGEPREVTSIARQRADYRTVINWAASNPDIDTRRIFIWGTSFSGMHVVEIAATDVRLRGAIAQCPLVEGLAGTKNVPLARLLRLVSVGSLDKLGSLVGRPHLHRTAAPGEIRGAISGEDAAIAGLSLITPPKGTDWHNRMSPLSRSLLGIGAHRPVRKAAGKIRCPILMIVAETERNRANRSAALCVLIARQRSQALPQPRRSLWPLRGWRGPRQRGACRGRSNSCHRPRGAPFDLPAAPASCAGHGFVCRDVRRQRGASVVARSAARPTTPALLRSRPSPAEQGRWPRR